VVYRGVKPAFVDLASRLTGGSVSWDVVDSYGPKLLKRYPSLAVWPADPQLALYLMAWVRGPGFNLPGFRRAVVGLVPDFRAASMECRMPDWGHSGIASLNAWVSRLFSNGQCVLDWGLKPELIYFPTVLADCGEKKGEEQ